MKFKVGDRVEYIGPGKGIRSTHKIGTIIYNTGSPYMVIFDTYPEPSWCFGYNLTHLKENIMLFRRSNGKKAA